MDSLMSSIVVKKEERKEIKNAVPDHVDPGRHKLIGSELRN